MDSPAAESRDLGMKVKHMPESQLLSAGSRGHHRIWRIWVVFCHFLLQHHTWPEFLHPTQLQWSDLRAGIADQPDWLLKPRAGGESPFFHCFGGQCWSQPSLSLTQGPIACVMRCLFTWSTFIECLVWNQSSHIYFLTLASSQLCEGDVLSFCLWKRTLSQRGWMDDPVTKLVMAELGYQVENAISLAVLVRLVRHNLSQGCPSTPWPCDPVTVYPFYGSPVFTLDLPPWPWGNKTLSITILYTKQEVLKGRQSFPLVTRKRLVTT